MIRPTPLQVLSVTGALVLLAGVANAQPGFGGRGSGGGRGMGGVGRLLMSQEVRDELEIVDEQQAELRAIASEVRDEMRSRMQEIFAGARDLSAEERQARMQDARAEMEAVRADVEKRVEGVLLPHQVQRLREIELQQQLRRGGSGVLTQGRVAEELGLTPEQQEKMRAKMAEAQANLQAKIEQLRREAREEVLSVLTASQRSKLDAMTGAEFKFPQNQRQFSGRQGRRNTRGEERQRPAADRPELE